MKCYPTILLIRGYSPKRRDSTILLSAETPSDHDRALLGKVALRRADTQTPTR